ncbi:MAG: PAS domain-containing protein [Halobacteriales archaeon]
MSSVTGSIKLLAVGTSPERFERQSRGDSDEQTNRDFEVVTTATAAEALDRLVGADNRFDCVVSRYELSDINGIKLLKTIREQRGNLPFILLVADGSESLAAAAVNAGATAYLPTDVDGERFRSTVIEAAERPVDAVVTDHLEDIADGFAVVDADWRLIYLNPSGARLVDRDIETVIGGYIWETFPDLQGTTFEEEYRQAMATGEPTSFEAYYPPVDAWFAVHVYPADERLAIYFIDISERKERQQVLRLERAITESLFEVAEDILCAIDTDRTFRRWNEHAKEVTGYDDEEIARMNPLDFIADADKDRASAAIEHVLTEGEVVIEEFSIVTADGEELMYEFTGSPVTDESGEMLGVIAIGRDIQKREEYEATLKALQETTYDLLRADDEAAIVETVVTAAEETLDLPMVAIHRWDEESGTLEPAALSESADAFFDERESLSKGESVAWEVFVEGELRTYEDITTADNIHNQETPIRSEILVPLGEYGVLMISSTVEGVFDNTDIEVAELLAATAEAALDRVQQEQALLDKENQLRRRTEQLTRRSRREELVRDINQDIMNATTREEIEQRILERLVEQDRYRFAWIGKRDESTGEFTERAKAGHSNGYLTELLGAAVSDEELSPPAIQAYDSGEVRVIDRIISDPAFEPWRATALNREFRSSIIIPLKIGTEIDAIMEIYASEPAAFGEEERELLTQLGKRLGQAIDITERKRRLFSDDYVELELDFTGTVGPLSRIAGQIGTQIELNDITPRSDGTWVTTVSLNGDDPERVQKIIDRHRLITDIERLESQTDDLRLELELAEFKIGSLFTEHGGTLQQLTADTDRTRVSAELPDTVSVRGFIQYCQDRHEGDVNLLAQREHNRTYEPLGHPTAALTDRQTEVLETAYEAGFFEWPRELSGEELAEQLDVTAPTVHQHLRKGIKRILELTIDSSTNT